MHKQQNTMDCSKVILVLADSVGSIDKNVNTKQTDLELEHLEKIPIAIEILKEMTTTTTTTKTMMTPPPVTLAIKPAVTVEDPVVKKMESIEAAADVAIAAIAENWKDFNQALIEKQEEALKMQRKNEELAGFLRMLIGRDERAVSALTLTSSSSSATSASFSASNTNQTKTTTMTTMTTTTNDPGECIYQLYFQELRNHDILIPNFNITDEIVNFKRQGTTIIHFAVMTINIVAVRLALKYKADVDINAVDVNGETALHKACQLMCSNIIELLLRNGATFMAIFDQNSSDEDDGGGDDEENRHHHHQQKEREPKPKKPIHQWPVNNNNSTEMNGTELMGKTLTSSSSSSSSSDDRQKLTKNNGSNKGGNGRRVIYTLL